MTNKKWTWYKHAFLGAFIGALIMEIVGINLLGWEFDLIYTNLKLLIITIVVGLSVNLAYNKRGVKNE